MVNCRPLILFSLEPNNFNYYFIKRRLSKHRWFMFNKRNIFNKLWLKYTDKTRYKLYKWELQNYKLEEVTNFYTGNNTLNTLGKIISECKTLGYINVMHSGNAGDVIYALPTLKKLHEITGMPINLYLRLGQPLVLSGYATHPLGTVMLNEKMFTLLKPLLIAQSYINICDQYVNQKIHVNLDIIRSKTISLDSGNIARWYSYFTGITPELWKAWLNVSPNESYAETIVLARSERYRNPSIDYSFLKQYRALIFVGVKSEYEDMQQRIPNLKWVQVNDFLELASIIAGCKLFIGNQSFPFSIAEGLKVPRILEVYYKVSNVIPEGENAHDFYFQNHFEELVQSLH